MQTKSCLPSFEPSIDTIEPQLEQILNKQRSAIKKHIKQAIPNNWQAAMGPLESLSNELEQFWSPIRHLHSVADNKELRKSYESCVPKLTQFYTELSLDPELLEFYQLSEKNIENLEYAQAAAIKHALRDFKLAGVELNDEDKKTLQNLNQRLSELSTKFANNVLDATDNWQLHLPDDSRLNGLNEAQKNMLAAKAKSKKLDGYLLGIDFPSYQAIATYADDRELRKTVYDAFVTRASSGEWDNSPLIVEILKLKQQKAKLLGFANYAELSIADKMANSTDEVIAFLEDLADKAKAQAELEFATLKTFAQSQGFTNELQPWDVAYYSEKLKQSTYQFDSEELRPYFAADNVITGLFAICSKLFSIEIKKHEQPFARWHDDVELYDIYRNQELIGHFYTDLYARDGKKGGAWMDSFCAKIKTVDNQLQLPVAYLTCNFRPPIDNKPGLLSHDEVTTLFHEFGHCIHHLLTEIDVYAVSGIAGVPWDGVELPSQFLENWCWQEESLAMFAKHVDDGQPLPKKLLEKALAAKNFQSGMFLVRQIEFALFDFKLHRTFSENDNIDNVRRLLQKVRQMVTVIPVVDYNRFENSFSHIFAGGYAAGYYSYLWAEVLSADAFSKFEEDGIFNQATGLAYWQKILSQGGADDFLNLFKAFRGREPKIDAFLRHCGLKA